MEFQEFRALFQENCIKNHLETYIDEEIIEKFYHLTNMMIAKNQVMNITAIRDIHQIIPLHYMDCIKIAHLIPQNACVLDVGCGGGFPTLPLAIIRPDLKITGIDSTEKKVTYVSETAHLLKLTNVDAISCRAEDLAKNEIYREKFDVVTSRAVARLNILDELCLPFVKLGGTMVILKGAMGIEELEEARRGIQTLGGDVENVIRDEIVLYNAVEQRCNIVIRKITHTDYKFPRQFGQIKKKPL